MKFRKKPVVIEAVRYEPDKIKTGDASYACQCCEAFSGIAHIHTLEGPMMVSPGDWIITGVKGERYPCNPEIFELTYEPVAEVPA